MNATVVIPTYNEEKHIEKCLESLLAQSYKDFEIIIVDDGSIDNTVSIVEDFILKERNKNISLLLQGHGGPGKARNLGAKKAKGEVLVFVDADMEFDFDYIGNLVEPILSKKHKGTWHNQEYVANPDNPWAMLWGGTRVNVSVGVKSNVYRAISKNLFMKAGGFDFKKGYFDDQTVYEKIKIPSFSVDAICYHYNPDTLIDVYKHAKWIGKSLLSKQSEIAFYLKKHLLKVLLLIIVLLIFGYNTIFNSNLLLISFLPVLLIYFVHSFIKTKNIEATIRRPFFDVFYWGGIVFGVISFFLN